MSVPVHSLGLSQIIGYGLLFYSFAALKSHISAYSGISESAVLLTLSAILILQSFVTPLVGALADRKGALWVMRNGFFLGGVGFSCLSLLSIGHDLNVLWMTGSFILIGIGTAMCTYEMAFCAAVQLNEKKSRQNISYITFYGAIASSLTWLLIYPILDRFGYSITCIFCAGLLFACAILINIQKNRFRISATGNSEGEVEKFLWNKINPLQKRALLVLAISGSMEYFLFSATTLLWIAWFTSKFNDAGVGIWLASIYGPFQLFGRVIEMRFGHHIDARITGLMAAALVPISIILAQNNSLSMAALAMALFGVGHGILTVSFGFITNLYFKAEVYGSAKGIIAAPRAFCSAIGPGIGGILFAISEIIFMNTMLAVALVGLLVFGTLLFIKPTNVIHLGD